MFTVIVDCVGSGTSRTWRPFESWYSVMPSKVRTLVVRSTVARAICGAEARGGGGVVTACGAGAGAPHAASQMVVSASLMIPDTMPATMRRSDGALIRGSIRG